MVRRINCSYTNYISYVIPKNVPLLTVEQNEAVTEEGIPFSWWVKWGKFYYYDENKKICEIDSDFESHEGYKRPSDFEDEEDGEDYESEDDTICPLCNKDVSEEIAEMNRCETCNENIGCPECCSGFTKKESSYCNEHEDDYESDSEEDSEDSEADSEDSEADSE